MDKVVIDNKTFVPYITSDEIQERIKEVAQDIKRDCAGKNPLFIGVLNMVPYLQVIGFLPTILLAILKAADTGGDFWVILASATAVFVVVQIIQDGLIVPRVMGRITGLNPAIILLSLSIWGSLMGMLGMIIALPLTTLMLSYYQRYIARREEHSDS